MGAFIAYRNQVAEATITAPPPPFSGQVVLAGYPLSNLATVSLGEACRIESGAPVVIELEFPFARSLNVVALLGLNFSPNVNAALTVSYSFNGIAWSTFGVASLLDNAALPLPGQLIVVNELAPNARYLRLEVNFDATDIFYVLGALFVDKALIVGDGIDAGWSLGFKDPGSVDYSGGEQPVQSVETITRRLSIPLEIYKTTPLMFGFSDADLIGAAVPSMQGLQMTAGTTGAVLVAPRTQTGLWMYRAAVYGRVRNEWAIGHKAGPRYGASIEVEEWR